MILAEEGCPMRYLAIAGMVLPLQGCLFFFYVPPTQQAGNACAQENTYVGQRIKTAEGRIATVEKVFGRNQQRCQETRLPVLVEARFD